MEKELLPQFSDDPTRGWGSDGFRSDWGEVTDVDAEGFLRGLDAGLITHIGRGLYRAPKSLASEQLFWSGAVKTTPRRTTLWIEPIITVAVLSRLHFDFAWPKELIGTQSKAWEFDVTTYLAADSVNEHIACEVKKSVHELGQLVELIQRFSARSSLDDPKSEKN